MDCLENPGIAAVSICLIGAWEMHPGSHASSLSSSCFSPVSM